jgi:hypothetical protein
VTDFRRVVRKLEDALRSGVKFYAIVAAVVALALVGVLEVAEDFFKAHKVEPITKILQAILEGTASAIIIYYLIDSRLAKIRTEIEKQISLIGKTNILAAVFNVNLDAGIVDAWSNYIMKQKISVQYAEITIVSIMERKCWSYGLFPVI